MRDAQSRLDGSSISRRSSGNLAAPSCSWTVWALRAQGVLSELSNPRVQDVEGLEWREWHVKFMNRKFARLRSFRACKIEHLMALRDWKRHFGLFQIPGLSQASNLQRASESTFRPKPEV